MAKTKSPTTGTETLRIACLARNHKTNLATMAKEELQIAPETLHQFMTGGDLPVDVLQRLAQALWSGAVEFDPVADRLRPGRRAETLPSPIRPDPVKPSREHLAEHGRARVPPIRAESPKVPPGWSA